MGRGPAAKCASVRGFPRLEYHDLLSLFEQGRPERAERAKKRVFLVFSSQKHLRCLGSRLVASAAEERDKASVVVDGRWVFIFYLYRETH